MNDPAIQPNAENLYQPPVSDKESGTVPATPAEGSGTFLTSSEAANLVGVDSRTIRRWFSSGKIKGKLDRHKLLVHADDVRKLAGTTPGTVSDFSPGQAADVSGIEFLEDDQVSGTGRDGLIEKLVNQLVGAASRVSWLESELANTKEEIKLLPDLQARAAELDLARVENDTLKQQIETLRNELEAAKRPVEKAFRRQ